MRAECLLTRQGHGAREAKGGAEKRTCPHTQGEHEGNHGKRGGPEAGGKGAPPPPPADRCRATCLHHARNMHAQEERATNPTTAAGKQGGYRVVMECACNVRATCLLPEAGTQGTKGTEGNHTANPPSPQRKKERNRSQRGGQEGKTPPPQTSAAPRACIMLAACMFRRKDKKGAPPPPHPHPLRKGARTARGRNGEMKGDAGVATRPEGETGGKQWGRQAA